MPGRWLEEENPPMPRSQPREEARPPLTEVSPPRKRPWLMALATEGSRRAGHGASWPDLGDRPMNSKVILTNPYQLKDAHGFCMVLYRQLSERRPQWYCQHPKGRFLKVQGRHIGTEPGLTGTSESTVLCQVGTQEPGRQGLLFPTCG